MSLTGEHDFKSHTKPDFNPAVSWSQAESSVPQQTHLHSLERLVGNMTLKNNTDAGTVDSAPLVAQPESYYEILGLPRLATNQDIEVAFLKNVRTLLRRSASRGLSLSRTERKELTTFFTTRDILLDSRSRDDHDFRLIRLQLSKRRTSRNCLEVKPSVGETRPAKAEALTPKGVLKPAEIKLALKLPEHMDKNKPVAEFPYSKQTMGLEELEAALLGEKLVQSGRASQDAVKSVFKSKYYFNVDFVDSFLAAVGGITLEDLTEVSMQLNLKIIAAKLATKSQNTEKRPAAII